MQHALNVVGDRKLAYVLLSMITEMTDLCIITQNNDEREAIKSVIGKFLEVLGPYMGKLKRVRIPKALVVTEDEYYDHWEEYSGMRLIFLEDSHLKWSILDDFSKYLKDIAKRHDTQEFIYLDLINMITLVDFLCSSVDLKPLTIELEIEVKKKRKEYIEKRKKAEGRLISFFMEKLKDKKKAELAFRILLHVAKKIYQ